MSLTPSTASSLTQKPWYARLSSAFSPIAWATLFLLVGACFYMTLGVQDYAFALPLRGQKLIAFLVAGYAVGVSTLLFQTLTQNPILTPSLLGFDALYVLIQSLLLFFLGMVGYVGLPELFKFGFEVVLMVSLSFLMFWFLFGRHTKDLTRLILVGVVFGILFRSLSFLVARMISPDEFVTVQAQSYASFSAIHLKLLTIAVVVSFLTMGYLWRMRFVLDVLMLGRACAIGLGVDYHKVSLQLLTVIALLVAMVTALVGPITFFGLLVCALTNHFSRSMYHSQRLILVTLTATAVLVVGQTIFEHILKRAGVLEVVIEFFGGIAFLLLIFGQYRRTRRRAI